MIQRVFRPRILAYGMVLFAIVAGLGTSLALRRPYRVDVIRDRGAMAREVEGGRIENVYRLQLMNASEARQHFHVSIAGIPGAAIASPPDIDVDPTDSLWLPVRVQVPPEQARALGPGAHPLHFEIARGADAGRSDPLSEKSTFVVPR